MDGASLIKLFALGLLIIASGFFSGSESALFSLGLYRVRRLKKYAQKSHVAAQKLLSVPTRLISTLLTGNELVNAAIGVVGSSLVYTLLRDRVSEDLLPFVAVGIILPFVLILGEIIPKTLGVKHPERFVSITAVPLLWFSNAVAPIRDFLAWLANRALMLTGQPPAQTFGVSEEVFRALVDAGKREGVVDEQERQLIHNVFNLDDIRVAQIMTPAEKVSALRVTMTVSDVMRRVEDDRYSRFPVLEADGRTIAGVFYAKDLLGLAVGSENESIRKIMRPPLLVSPETTALGLFASFRSKRTHIASVRRGSDSEMIGVVTLEDVLEEIFGAIRDEQDVEENRP